MSRAATASCADVIGLAPPGATWAVAFRVADLRRALPGDALRAMFGVPSDRRPWAAGHVLLTSAGPALVTGGRLDPYAGPLAARPGPRLADRCGAALDRLDPGDASCVGAGLDERGGAVAMCVHLGPDGRGPARAVLPGPPGAAGLPPLLAAVGVRPGDVTAHEGGATAGFAFDLHRHAQSARLAGYRRTASCVAFFTEGCRGDGPVGRGLGQALAARVRSGRDALRLRAVRMVEDGADLAMTAVGPGGEWAEGDVVPAGMLLAGLRVLPPGRPDPAEVAACGALRARLEAARMDGGWPFHAGTLPTAADSALVLLGLRDAAAVDDLERYADGEGGYLPQLVSDDGAPGTMRRHAARAHWERADLVTTCLVRHLRAEGGLPERTPLAWLQARLAGRRGLFTASSWLVDWAMALALAGDPHAAGTRERLRDELLAARNEDGSFGRDDERPLATAAAAAALWRLGVRGRLLAHAQLRLVEAMEHPAVQVPFVSTERAGGADAVRGLVRGAPWAAVVDGAPHVVTRYRDAAGAVTLGLALLALGHPGEPADDDTALLPAC